LDGRRRNGNPARLQGFACRHQEELSDGPPNWEVPVAVTNRTTELDEQET